METAVTTNKLSDLTRGFTESRLQEGFDSRVKEDEHGYYIISLSENEKVYFNDFYDFLGVIRAKAVAEQRLLAEKISLTSPEKTETLNYYQAKRIIVDVLLRTIIKFCTDDKNLGVIMTPWCFSTVVLERVEVYRDRLSKGEVTDPNIQYSYDVIRYINEIYKATLLELFDFPEKAFQMRWQYTELLKRYADCLKQVSVALQKVLDSLKSIK